MKSVGVFGGSFDPFHEGHRHVIQEVAKLKLFETLVIVPNFQSPLKTQTMLSGVDRLKAIKAEIPSLPKGLQYELCDWEVVQNKPCWTIDTLAYLTNIYPDTQIYWVMGSDSFFSLHRWKRYEDIVRQVKCVVVRRDNVELNQYESYAKKYLKASVIVTGDCIVEKSSSEIKKSSLIGKNSGHHSI